MPKMISSLSKTFKTLFDSKWRMLCWYAIWINADAVTYPRATSTLLHSCPQQIKSGISNAQIAYQFDYRTQCLSLMVGKDSTLRWYVLGQCYNDPSVFLRSAVGLQFKQFFCAYPIYPWTRKDKTRLFIGWTRSLDRSRRYLEKKHVPFYYLLTLKGQHFLSCTASMEQRKKLIEALLSRFSAATLRNTQTCQIPPDLVLPGATVAWDRTGHYLSITAPAVDLGKLVRRLKGIAALKAVQICTEAIRVPMKLFLPFSLEVVHRSSKLSQLFEENIGIPAWSSSICLTNWKVNGDLVWYSPHDFFWITGKVLIMGDACFQIRGMQLSGRSNLEVEGTLAVFNQLWLGGDSSNLPVLSRYLGLGIAGTSSLQAGQCFMQLDRFRNEYTSKLAFLNGGIISADHLSEPPPAQVSRYIRAQHLSLNDSTNISSKKNQAAMWCMVPNYVLYEQSIANPLKQQAKVLYYAPFMTPQFPISAVRKMKSRKTNSAFRGNAALDHFFNHHRSQYYQLNEVPELEQDAVKMLSNFWHMLRSSEITSLFTQSECGPLYDRATNDSNHHQIKRGYGIQLNIPTNRNRSCTGYNRSCILLFFGMREKKMSINKSGSLSQVDLSMLDRFSELFEFPASKEFLSYGVQKICKLYGSKNRLSCKLAREIWCSRENSFFNKKTFLVLLAPFVSCTPGACFVHLS